MRHENRPIFVLQCSAGNFIVAENNCLVNDNLRLVSVDHRALAITSCFKSNESMISRQRRTSSCGAVPVEKLFYDGLIVSRTLLLDSKPNLIRDLGQFEQRQT